MTVTVMVLTMGEVGDGGDDDDDDSDVTAVLMAGGWESWWR